MPELDDLKSRIAAAKEQKKSTLDKKEDAPVESMDMEQVEKIVSRMKKKYTAEGIEFEEVSGKMSEIRNIITGGDVSEAKIQTADELADYKSPLISQLGKIYLLFKWPFDSLVRLIRNFSFAKDLAYQLYSANMKFSVQQYLIISLVTSAIFFFLSFAVSFFGLTFAVEYLGFEFLPLELAGFKILWNFVLAAAIAFVVAIFVFLIAILYPKSSAKKRADDISLELPFALRHMSTELKSGIGLYKTLQAIAVADYGVLSEEFARTINEVEEGTDAKDALRHFALRTQSKALRSALLQIIRALKTGGNLSGIMNQIAEDVSFELGMRIRDFGEKMNFFGVLFIIGAIVMPVFVAILGAIFNTPFGTIDLSFDPRLILLFYVVMMPFVLMMLVMYLKMIEPKV